MRLTIVSLIMLLLPSLVRAQADVPELDARAQVHFQAGRDYYERGDYENALRELTIAYDMSHRPQLLYNLGATHERLGHAREAADFFDQYLAALPDVENAVAIAERARRLRERADAGTTEATEPADDGAEADDGAATVTEAPAAASSAPTDSGSSGFHPHPAAFVVLGAGALGLATFAVLGALTLTEDDALAAECGTACPPSRVSTLESLGLGADISLGIGAALALTGVILLFVTTDDSAPSTSVRLGPTSVSVSATF